MGVGWGDMTLSNVEADTETCRLIDNNSSITSCSFPAIETTIAGHFPPAHAVVAQ